MVSAARWFLRNRRNHLAPADEISLFGGPIKSLVKSLPKLLRGDPKDEWETDYLALTEAGVPKDLAQMATIPATNISAVEMLYIVKVSFKSKINKHTINCLIKPVKLGGL